MLAFGTASKKKKRNWREAVAESEGDDTNADEAINDTDLEEFMKQEAAEEAKQKEEAERIEKVKAESAARAAARKAKWAEQRVEKRQRENDNELLADATAGEPSAGDGWDGSGVTKSGAGWENKSALPPGVQANGAAPVSAGGSGGITEAACTAGRCVRVDNVSMHSSESDVKMLMEGFGSIKTISKNAGGVYGIEYANPLSAEDAAGEQAVGSSKGSVLAGRQLAVILLRSTGDLLLHKSVASRLGRPEGGVIAGGAVVGGGMGGPGAGGSSRTFFSKDHRDGSQGSRERQVPGIGAGRGSAPGNSRFGDPDNWRCPQCANENWPNRLECNRCHCPRPLNSRRGAMSYY